VSGSKGVDENGIGMDMTYAFTNFLYGNETADQVMGIIEYAPYTNPIGNRFLLYIRWVLADIGK
jgi:hypothetical protein